MGKNKKKGTRNGTTDVVRGKEANVAEDQKQKHKQNGTGGAVGAGSKVVEQTKDVCEIMDKMKTTTVGEPDIQEEKEGKKEERQNERQEDLEQEPAKVELEEKQNGKQDDLEQELLRIREERDHYETQYNTLLSRLSSMKSLFSKMKESQLELERNQETLGEYERQNMQLKERIERITGENEEYKASMVALNHEITKLNNECEDLSSECGRFKAAYEDANDKLEDIKSVYSKEMFEQKRQNESLAVKVEELTLMVEHGKRDNASVRQELQDYQQQVEAQQDMIEQQQKMIVQLEKQLEVNNDDYEAERQKLQKENESNQNALIDLNDKLKSRDDEMKKLHSELEVTKKDAELKVKYEQECKERVLQIGKLRHEAVILNEHLTKALALIKSAKNSETVDKELISNLIISFVSIPRGDPKKFEVLELISNFLNWDNDKKSHAGLIHTNLNSNHPNTVSTNSYSPKDASNNKSLKRPDSFVSLWAEFLERESEPGQT